MAMWHTPVIIPKMIFTKFLVKCRCTDASTSAMAESNVIIYSPMTSLLGIDPSVRRDNNPLLCQWSFEPAIIITCGSMLIVLRTLIVMPADCPQSYLGAVNTAKRENGASRDSLNWQQSDT